MSSPLNRTDAPYQFHAFEVSYFSAKVRPALRYKGLWYDERRADIQEIIRRTGLGFIPIVVTPEDETWQDSTDIYRLLEERHPEPPSSRLMLCSDWPPISSSSTRMNSG